MDETLKIGWREWVSLPEFCDVRFRAKIDTGAKTSALHARDLKLSDDGELASFWMRSRGGWIEVRDIPVVEHRVVRSSNGKVEDRPVIRTMLAIGGESWPILVTLTNRKRMKYRMLIGREALTDRAVVHPGSSYLLIKK
jgi:hypothetical protein